MEVGVVCKALPDEMVEKIIAMVPFPQIFKARVLSRSWYARFQPQSLLNDPEEQRLVAGFQRRVLEESKNWDVFRPLCTTDDHVTVYSQVEKKWQRLPSLHLPFFYARNENLRNLIKVRGTFLPREELNLLLEGRNLIKRRGTVLPLEELNLLLEGPFVYGIWQKPGFIFKILVRNVLTGECKQLPEFFEADRIIVRHLKLVIDSSAETYKVIVVCQRMDDPTGYEGMREQYSIRVYDSMSGFWSSGEYAHSIPIELSNFVYLNGIFYALSLFDTTRLLAFDVEEGTLEEIRLEIIDDGERWTFDDVSLVVCYGNLILTMMSADEAVYILKIDLVSHRVSEVACCHARDKLDVINTREMINSLVSEVDCLVLEKIPLHLDKANPRIAVYNILKDEWRFFFLEMQGYLWSECCFQPVLNPFMAV